MDKNRALKTYVGLRLFSSLFFAVIVTVNLVYQATVVGLNPLQLVLVGTLLEVVSFLFEVPTGIVADLYSRKLSVIIGVFLIGIGFTIEGSIPTFAAVLLAQVVWGIGFTFVSGAREAWIADEVGEEKAGKAFIKGQQASQVGTFIGIALSIILADINIRVPIILGGILYSSQALFLAFFMPENNFSPTSSKERETFAAMKHTFVSGIRLVRENKVLLFVILTGMIFGMFSEGFDRLWTPYMINSFVFPTIWNLKPVVWFGIISMVSTILATIVTEVLNRKTDTNDHKSTVKALFIVNLLLTLGVVAFGLAGGFVAAIAAYWFATMFREARGPIYDAWTNQNLEPQVRATVFSMCSQANAIGQIVGGPILGIIASAIAIRTSIVLAGLILVPTLFLYSHSFRKHKLVV